MSWYLKARKAYWLFGFGMALGVLTVLFASRALPVPNFSGDAANGVPAAFILPAVGAAVLMAGLADSGRGAERTAVRHVKLMDLALVLVIGFAVGAFPLIFGLAQQEFLLVCSARNLIGYIGLGLVARPVVGPLAASGVPIITAMFAGAFGQSRETLLLFWPLNPVTATGSWLIALALFVVGLAILAHRKNGRSISLLQWKLDGGIKS